MNFKPRALRALTIGGSLFAAVSLTAVAVHAATASPATSPASMAAARSAGGFHPFTIVSPDFREDAFLPVSAEFGGPGSAGSGCNGQNQAPALHWYNVPAGTKSFAFTITDVDAPVADFFHHWIVYNIPRNVTTLHGHGSNPFSEGTNDYPTIGYGGPCPPPDGQIHHYIFTVYALSVPNIPGTHITYTTLISEIGPDVVGATSTIGKFRLPLAG
jgi:Raf kinase inhibitor-like YbhB/YbcL family protein